MRTWTILLAFLFLAIAAGVPTARALTQDELIARIQAAGYTQVSEIKSTAEGDDRQGGQERQAGAAPYRRCRPDQRAELNSGNRISLEGADQCEVQFCR
ncbi:hypothetical protein [Bradyrhizobium diazoefficiens]